MSKLGVIHNATTPDETENNPTATDESKRDATLRQPSLATQKPIIWSRSTDCRRQQKEDEDEDERGKASKRHWKSKRKRTLQDGRTGAGSHPSFRYPPPGPTFPLTISWQWLLDFSCLESRCRIRDGPRVGLWLRFVTWYGLSFSPTLTLCA